MVEKLQDALHIGFHEAEKLRIRLRTDLAKSASWSASLTTICKTIESGSNYDEDLFGTEFGQRYYDTMKTQSTQNIAWQSQPRKQRIWATHTKSPLQSTQSRTRSRTG
jgi:hypothetical protein